MTRTTSTYYRTQGILVHTLGQQIQTGLVWQSVARGGGQLGSAPAMGWAPSVSCAEVLSRRAARVRMQYVQA